MPIFAITGDRATGKTLNKFLLQKNLKARRIVDGWYPGYPSKLRDGDLILTNVGKDAIEAAVPEARVTHISTYIRLPGFITPRPSGPLGAP